MKPSINVFLLVLIIVAPISWALGHYLGFWGAILSLPFGGIVGYSIPKIIKD